MEVSLFDGMTSKRPIRGSIEAVAETIRSDEKLAALTQLYRQSGDKQYKHEAVLFAVAAVFDGGKSPSNIQRPTGLSLVDFDHVFETEAESPKDDKTEAESPKDVQDTTPSASGGCDILSKLKSLKQKLVSDPHTLLCYITMSGNGLRVIYRYELESSASLPIQLKLYPQAFARGNDYYEKLIGKPADPQCKNITRLSGLAHDSEVYLNPNAIAFTADEIKSFHSSAVKKQKSQKQLDRIQYYYDNIIKPKLANDKIVYSPGNHNNYVMRVGYMLAKKRYAQSKATEWAKQQFPEYDGVEGVFKSCYANTLPHKDGNSATGESDGKRFANVDEIKDFLDGHIHLRRNVITHRIEYLATAGQDEKEKSDKDDKWENLIDQTVNTLWVKMSEVTRVNKGDMLNVIESDYTPSYHPFRTYLDGLPPWHEGDHDYIADLAATVKVRHVVSTAKNEPKELPKEFDFEFTLKKWLTAMIAGWLDDESVNNVILVFIGEQGAYKSTWFNYLLPPELRRYFYTKTNSRRMSKDDLIALAEYGLVCCEELDTMSPSELNQLKAAVTMTTINERAAYARYAEQRKHICAFCGTGNNVNFLSDPTGNRRWMPYEIESIQSPREHPFCYEGIYAQAYALYKSGFRYWFTQEEVRQQNLQNKEFEAPRLEEELVDLYFRKPLEGETGELVSVARALQIISGNVAQKLSAVNVGRAFKSLGFKPGRTNRMRGYIAVLRTADEIKGYQVAQGIEAQDWQHAAME